MARAMHMTKDITMRDTHFWWHAILAGVIGGAVFLVAEMLLVTLTGQSPWAPPRMIAAMILGESVLPPPATLDGSIMMAAMLVHFPLSMVYGVVIGWIVQRTARYNYTRALAEGAVIGLAIYLVNFHLIASFVFEWFAMARNWVSVVAHLIFGLATAWAYLALAQPRASRNG